MAKITQVTVMDSGTGEVLVDKTLYGARSKGGWVMFYQEAGMKLIADAPSPAVLKIFMYLALGQTYEGGMKTTKADIQRKLGLCKATVHNAFKWLKEHLIVHEWRVNGCTEFMISPVYVCLGRFDDRMKIWNERWNFKPQFVRTDYLRKKQSDEGADESSAS